MSWGLISLWEPGFRWQAAPTAVPVPSHAAAEPLWAGAGLVIWGSQLAAHLSAGSSLCQLKFFGCRGFCSPFKSEIIEYISSGTDTKGVPALQQSSSGLVQSSSAEGAFSFPK